MKRKLIISLLMAAGLMVSGAASATLVWTGLLSEWASAGTITDGDMEFKLYAAPTDIPDGTKVVLIENEVGSLDFYHVILDWGPNGYAGGGRLVFAMKSTNVEVIINTARFQTGVDLIPGGATTGLMRLYDLPATTLFAKLSSINGDPDHIANEAGFTGRSRIFVVQDFFPTTSGLFQDAFASFTTQVPEPGALSLLGLGLAGLMMSRRRKV